MPPLFEAFKPRLDVKPRLGTEQETIQLIGSQEQTN